MSVFLNGTFLEEREFFLHIFVPKPSPLPLSMAHNLKSKWILNIEFSEHIFGMHAALETDPPSAKKTHKNSKSLNPDWKIDS